MAIVVCSQCGAKNRIDEEAAQRARPVCGRCGTVLPAVAPPASGTADKPLTVTDATFARDVLGGGATPILLDCWAPWCGPCRMLTPILDQLARESAGRYVIAKLNTDENPGTAGQFRIDSIPAMLFFKNGQLVDRLVGLAPKPAIAQRLAKLM